MGATDKSVDCRVEFIMAAKNINIKKFEYKLVINMQKNFDDRFVPLLCGWKN